MENPISGAGHWYQKWWGVVLIGFVSLILVGVLAFGSIVGYYVWKIKQGEGGEILNELNRGQTQAAGEISSQRKGLETADDPALGNPDAKIVIVEFVDFKCPNCKKEDPIIKKVSQKYWSKVKIIARDFPAESIHAGASELALLASCAHEQGKYWALQDIFFANQEQLPGKLSEAETRNLLGQAGVDFEKTKQCLAQNKVKTEVNRDYTDGFKYGVAGTPTFFVNGNKLEGVVTWEAWEQILGGL